MKKEHDIRINRKLLHPRLDYLLDKLLKECAKNNIYIIVTEGFRDQKRQNELYAQGRTKKGSIVTYAKDALSSHHGWGVAIDFAINDSTLLYNAKYMSKVGAIAKSVGLGWGGDWKGFVDTPHIYLPSWGSTTKKLKSKYKTLLSFQKTWTNYVTAKPRLVLWKDKKLKVKLDTIPTGRSVEVLYKKKLSTIAKVRYNGKVGYVRKKHLK